MIEMQTQIGPIKYDKHEEKIFTKSLYLSILIGSPLGILINFLLGFPTVPKKAPINIIEWVTVDVLSITCIFGIWWILIMGASSFLLYKSERGITSWRIVGKNLVSFIIILIGLLCMISVLTIIYLPLDAFLLQFYSPYATFWYGILVATPFVILFLYIALPHLRPRIRRQLRLAMTYRFWKKCWRTPKSRKKIEVFLVLVVMALVLHLIPLLT